MESLIYIQDRRTILGNLTSIPARPGCQLTNTHKDMSFATRPTRPSPPYPLISYQLMTNKPPPETSWRWLSSINLISAGLVEESRPLVVVDSITSVPRGFLREIPRAVAIFHGYLRRFPSNNL